MLVQQYIAIFTYLNSMSRLTTAYAEFRVKGYNKIWRRFCKIMIQFTTWRTNRKCRLIYKSIWILGPSTSWISKSEKIIIGLDWISL